MKKLSILFIFLLVFIAANATNNDSTTVVTLLREAPKNLSMNEYMVHFGTKLEGTPYVAKTLEVNSPKEKLVINLHELDCSTFVENVLALSICARNKTLSYKTFCNTLQKIRYRQGVISYTNRLHYFSSWIEDNTQLGFVSEITSNKSPFLGKQTLKLNYMSTHPSAYPQLSVDNNLVKQIAQTEKELSGKVVRYIPKSQLSKYDTLRKYIKNGDIIAIVTNKKGLDTSHLGIAMWHSDGTLHLLNASQIHKKVIDEPMTLYTYMQKHSSQLGIRIVRPEVVE